MDKSFSKSLIYGFILAFIISCIVEFFAIQSLRTLIDNSNQVSKTYLVLEEIYILKENLSTTESDIRGYAISGSRSFLNDSKLKAKQTYEQLETLKNETKDNEIQHKILEDLMPFILAKIEFANEIEELVRSGKKAEAEALISEGRGKQLMENCTLLIDEMKLNEEKTLVKRSDDNKYQVGWTKSILYAAAFFFLFLLLAGSRFVYMNTRRNQLLQKRLRENEARLFNFLNKMPLGVIVIDKEGKPLFFNDEAKRILVLESNTDKTLAGFQSRFEPKKLDGSDFPKADLPLSQALKGNYTDKAQFKIRIHNEEIIIEEHTSPIFNENGEVEYAISAFTDITKRKEAEEDLKKSKRFAENLLRTQEIFVSNISHEIRTPLNAILGFASLLLRAKLLPEQKEQILSIKQSGETLLTIINDILDMSKIESGMMTLEKIPFSIESLILSLKTMLDQKAHEKLIQFNVKIAEDIPQVVSGDPTRLTQILLNLAHNAIKFTEQGKVTIEVSTVEINEEKAIIKFEIKDTGVGIPSDKIEKIFERFLQANSDTTRKFGGTGLGLNIAKNLVIMQKGKIDVESIEGVGSVFTVKLPFQIVKDSQAFKKNPEIFSIENFDKNIRILLVEDNFLNQKLATAVLTNFGFDVTLAKNGKEAVSMLEKKIFDSILMDLQMPEMDGYTASEIIRGEISREIPIIAMTAHAMPGEKEKCLSYGMNDYISKPFNEQELLKKIIFHHQLKKNKENLPTFINLDYLKSLSVSDPNFMKDMLQTFIQDAPLLMKELKEAVINNNIKRIKAIAHNLKSNFAFLGVEDLKIILEEMENIPEDDNEYNYSLSLIEIEKVYEKIYEEAKTEVNKLEEKL